MIYLVNRALRFVNNAVVVVPLSVYNDEAAAKRHRLEVDTVMQDMIKRGQVVMPVKTPAGVMGQPAMSVGEFMQGLGIVGVTNGLAQMEPEGAVAVVHNSPIILPGKQ